MKKLLLLFSVLLLVLFSTNLKAQYTITIDSVVATIPISCFGDLAAPEVQAYPSLTKKLPLRFRPPSSTITCPCRG